MSAGKILLGRWIILDVNRRSLINQAGREQHLTYKSSQLIHFLALHASVVVGRETLIELVWGDNFQLGSIRLYDEIWKIRQALNKLGVEDVRVLTIPRRGYCLEIDENSESESLPHALDGMTKQTLPPRLVTAWLLALPMVIFSLLNMLKRQADHANNEQRSNGHEFADFASGLTESLVQLASHHAGEWRFSDFESLICQLESALKGDPVIGHITPVQAHLPNDVNDIYSWIAGKEKSAAHEPAVSKIQHSS